ncbi:hypothetical protein AMTRI_Chr04g190490 [Amborella trichopoda]
MQEQHNKGVLCIVGPSVSAFHQPLRPSFTPLTLLRETEQARKRSNFSGARGSDLGRTFLEPLGTSGPSNLAHVPCAQLLRPGVDDVAVHGIPLE